MSKADTMVRQFLATARGQQAARLLAARTLDVDAFLPRVRGLVLPVCEELREEIRGCTAQDLCGDEVWRTWPHGVRRAAGICLSHLVEVQALPLCRVNTKRQKKRYNGLPAVATSRST